MNIKHVLRSNSIVQCVVLVHNVCTSVSVSFREMPVMVYEYARTTLCEGPELRGIDCKIRVIEVNKLEVFIKNH